MNDKFLTVVLSAGELWCIIHENISLDVLELMNQIKEKAEKKHEN